MKKLAAIALIASLLLIGSCQLMVDKLRSNRIKATRLGIESDESIMRELRKITDNAPQGRYSRADVKSARERLEQVKESKQSRTRELEALPRPLIFFRGNAD